jgi:hypothetical protein
MISLFVQGEACASGVGVSFTMEACFPHSVNSPLSLLSNYFPIQTSFRCTTYKRCDIEAMSFIWIKGQLNESPALFRGRIIPYHTIFKGGDHGVLAET